MTLKIKTPPSLPMPEAGYLGDDASYGYDQSDMAAQLAARDAQWMELVGNLTDALWSLLDGSQQVGEMHWTGMDELSPWDKARAALRAITEEQE